MRHPKGGLGFPEGASFAFTIVDDTDDATVENVKPVYDLLHELGLRTTKTVWAKACPEGSELFFAGKTLDDPEYLSFVVDLASRGFEIAFHGATMESSFRPRTELALERLRELFVRYPRLHCNHGHNRENLYWGLHRYQSLPVRFVASLALVRKKRPSSEGHVDGTPYFWGDLARRHVEYVRNFTFRKLDMSRVYPGGPYSLASTPYVRNWFHSADAPDGPAFKALVTRDRIDALAKGGGYCILSTHFGKRFVQNGAVDPGVRDRLEYIAAQKGWFVPASELLDWLGSVEANPLRMVAVESSHILDRITSRT